MEGWTLTPESLPINPDAGEEGLPALHEPDRVLMDRPRGHLDTSTGARAKPR
jgi:hypothetical protein